MNLCDHDILMAAGRSSPLDRSSYYRQTDGDLGKGHIVLGRQPYFKLGLSYLLDTRNIHWEGFIVTLVSVAFTRLNYY